MKAKILQFTDYLPSDCLSFGVAVVIDVLRATSLIVTALDSGVKEVFVEKEVSKAIEKANALGRSKCILAGERKMKQIDGFDSGNSPVFFRHNDVYDKSVVLTTTNGASALYYAGLAQEVYVASFLNSSAMGKFLANKNEDIVLICSGTNGQFSLDDGFCAGMLLSAINEYCELELDDLGELLMDSYHKNANNFKNFIKKSKSSQNLINLGFGLDVDYCLQRNVSNSIPKCVAGKIKIVATINN